MADKVLMPKTGADATEAKLVRWFKHDGDAVNRGDVVAEIETEKVNMEVEAYYAGTLHILAAEGTTMEVGKPIALLLKAGEQPPAAQSAPAAPPAQAAQSARPAPAATGTPEAPADQPATQTPGPAPAAPVDGQVAAGARGAAPVTVAAQAGPAAIANGRLHGERIKASPLARRMAQEHNLDLAAIAGSGPGGRVIREDIEAAMAAQAAPAVAAPAAAPVEYAPVEALPAEEAAAPAPVAAGAVERPLTRLQLGAARRLTESKQQAPHFYLTIEVDMAEAMRLRKTLNEQAGGELKVSVNDLVIKASAHALSRHLNINSSYRDGRVLLHEHVNVAVAIDTEEGLITPVIQDADKKSLGQIARESRALAERARGKRLRPEDFADGTFTVSNLGMFEIDTFVAIINPPQAAILAVGAVRQVPVVRDGQITIGEIMKVTLSADHRATDGAAGARFLADLRKALEKPLLMAL